MTEPGHIINKFIVDIDTKDVKTAHFINDFISGFLQDDLLPQFEQIFEKYNPGGEVVRLDELKLELTFSNWKNPDYLKTEICKRLDEKLKSKIPFARSQNTQEFTQEIIRKVSPEKNRENVFLFYLENGYLPWFGKQEHIREISQIKVWKESLQSEFFTNRLFDLVNKYEVAFDRLILQFPPEVLLSFLARIHQTISNKDEQKVIQLLQELSNSGAHLILKIVGNFILKKSSESVQINHALLEKLVRSENKLSGKPGEKIRMEIFLLIQKFQPESTKYAKWKEWFQSETLQKRIPESDKETDHVKQERGKKEDSEYFDEKTNEVAVKNAGLILLHPFFKSFFNELIIIDKNDQFLPGKKEQAVQALFYLATGFEDFFEGNLVLEKFLCNVPLKQPLSKESLLNDFIKKEANDLLEQVVKHWPALKNTLVGGLQQLFIQRNGKLVKKEDNYKLIVERKAQDVLLEKLDWNISVIKLSWIEKLLYVEW